MAGVLGLSLVLFNELTGTGGPLAAATLELGLWTPQALMAQVSQQTHGAAGEEATAGD